MDKSFKRTIDNDFDAFARVAVEFSATCEAWNVPVHTCYKIDLALEELVTNIIKYGYDDTALHSIDIEISQAPDGTVALTLVDDGHYFDPTGNANRAALTGDQNIEELQVGGWGLTLVRKNSATFTYERREERNCTRVTF